MSYFPVPHHFARVRDGEASRREDRPVASAEKHGDPAHQEIRAMIWIIDPITGIAHNAH
jgi:hypothetical protein